jgi:lysophospholipid acyltransferase (LPLAT)-like uncharacterized protein
MKLRNPRLIRAAARLGGWAVRGWMGTQRFEYRPLGPDYDPRRPGFTGQYVYAFWHEHILLPAYLYGRPDIHVLISQHADGQLIAEVAGRLGFATVRGSTTRGGIEAVRRMLRSSRDGHLAVTPDGPRGPRRRVQPGVVYLASRLGLPVVPFGVGYDRPWRMSSWDRFAVPRPFGRAVLVTTEAIAIPENADRDVLERCRREVEDALNHATDLAEGWAAGEMGEDGGAANPVRRSA